MALKYLFHAVNADGATFVQNPEDVGVTRPGASGFTDYLAWAETHRPVRFALRDETGDVLAVDLRDGHFERAGAPLWAGDPPPAGLSLRLIFFRRHVHVLTLGLEELAHGVRYFVGWQTTTADGRNLQQVLAID